MSREVLKLTALLGERDRSDDGRLLVDDLLDLLGRHKVAGSVLLRGIEGFGLRRRLATERLLTLSEDLPLMAVATDEPERIGALLGEADALMAHGLLTLERARAIGPGETIAAGGRAQGLPAPGAGVRLTCHVGRGDRIGGAPAHRHLVDHMRDAGMDAGVTLLGVDGTRGGVRIRARFFAANAEVPLVISAVGDPAAADRAVTALHAAVRPGLLTAERVTICVRAGAAVAPLPPADPPPGAGTGPAGAGPAGAGPAGAGSDVWQKITVHLADRERHAGPGAYVDLLRALREAGAAGATVLRGVWGFQGSGPPHGDRPLGVPRRAPLICVAIDRPAAVARWFEAVQAATRAAEGLAFAEQVPALRARAPGHVEGALRLARS